MEGQQQQTISAEGLQSLYTDLGAKTHAVYELQAQLTKLQQMKAISEQLIADHGPDKCVPIAPADEAEEPGG